MHMNQFTSELVPVLVAGLSQSWIFGPAGIIRIGLYVLMSIALILLLKKGLGFPRAKIALGFFIASVMCNVAWFLVFFAPENQSSNAGLALTLAISLCVTSAAAVISLWKISKAGMVLLIPHFIWASLVVVLNYQLWLLLRA